MTIPDAVTAFLAGSVLMLISVLAFIELSGGL